MEQSSAKPPWQGWHKTACSTAWEGSLGWELCSGCQDPTATQSPIKREIYAAPFRLFSVNISMFGTEIEKGFLWCWAKRKNCEMAKEPQLWDFWDPPGVWHNTPKCWQRSGFPEGREPRESWAGQGMGETKGNAATSTSGLFFESNMTTNSKQFVTHHALWRALRFMNGKY